MPDVHTNCCRHLCTTDHMHLCRTCAAGTLQGQPRGVKTPKPRKKLCGHDVGYTDRHTSLLQLMYSTPA